MGLDHRVKPTAGCGPYLVTQTCHKQREGLLASPYPSTNFLGKVVSQWRGLWPEGLWPDFWKQQMKSYHLSWPQATSPSGLRHAFPPATLTFTLGELSPWSPLFSHLECPSPSWLLHPQRPLPVLGALTPLCRLSFLLHLMIHFIQSIPSPICIAPGTRGNLLSW